MCSTSYLAGVDTELSEILLVMDILPPWFKRQRGLPR